MRTRPRFFYRQSGVIPYRRRTGDVEILLVTTRGSGRWTIPKGVVDIGRTPVDSAVKEAYEEAGIRGTANDVAVGSYSYRKWGGECTVEVFLLCVEEMLDEWPEDDERKREWMPLADAVEAVHNAGLRALLDGLSV